MARVLLFEGAVRWTGLLLWCMSHHTLLRHRKTTSALTAPDRARFPCLLVPIPTLL